LPVAIQKKKNIKTVGNTILLAVLCGHGTWRFTFICKDILRVFENRVLRETMGSKREIERRMEESVK
jgi:hypothetical protein